MESRKSLRIAGFPPGAQEKNIVDAAGSNWIALAVDDDQLAVLKLIVPRGRTVFPCPHLVADEQGKNWLVRPDATKNLLVSGNSSAKLPLIKDKGQSLCSPRGKTVIIAGFGAQQPLQKLDASDSKTTASIALPIQAEGEPRVALTPKADNTAVRSPTATGKFKQTILRPAGKPKTVARGALSRPRKDSLSVDNQPVAPLSAFAPKPPPEKMAPLPPDDRFGPKFASAPASASETSLVKPAWVRLKEKVSNRSSAESSSAARLEEIEILATPPAAWKLWLHRLLPPASVFLLALGSWQLAGGY